VIGAGNETCCQTPPVFRQAAYQQRMAKRLHPNAVIELDIARECWESSIAGQHVSEYIQQLGVHPFHVVFYTEQQLQLYINACRTTEAVVHVDATGSVIANIPGQKRPLYYCLLLHDGSLPVMDILTTRHSGEWLHSLLLMFNASVRLINRGSLVTPRQIVTDFSYALMSACLAAFNSAMSIDGYLSFTYRCISRHYSTAQLTSFSYLTLCMAHMMKTVSIRVCKVESRPQIRKFTVTSFAALQRTQELRVAQTLYRNVYVALVSKRETEAVVAARQQILQAVSHTNSVGEPSQEDAKLNRLKYSDVRTLKDRSPYTAEFGRAIDDVLLDDDDDSCPENATCSPQSFQAIKSIMHLYPLWSATFQTNIERFGNNASTAQVASDDAEPICQTNAAVESHFKPSSAVDSAAISVVDPISSLPPSCSMSTEKSIRRRCRS